MKKEEFCSLLETYGDAVVNYRSVTTNKLKYSVVTTNFHTDYIRKKYKKLKNVNEKNVVVFSWDEDRYKVINPDNITSVVPVSNMIGSF